HTEIYALSLHDALPISDEMGLGKTIQAAAWLQLRPEKRPAIILCPASLKLNWAKELRDTLSTGDRVQILQGTKPYPITGSIIIIDRKSTRLNSSHVKIS